MEITIAEERALFLKEQFSLEQAEGRAWSKRAEAFGALARMSSLIQREKGEDFTLVYKEHRYQPFWHVVCGARYIYERNRQYELPLSSHAVETVTIEGMKFPAKKGKISLTGLEHCREEYHEELYVDGVSGEKNSELSRYKDFSAVVIDESELDEISSKGAILVPPQERASAIVREILARMIQQVQADKILEEKVEIERVDLYYRPVYAFQYHWESREKEAVMSFDAVTGELQAGGDLFKQYVGKVLDPEFLFDLGVDTVDLLVPGGGIAVKLARKGLEVARKRSKDK